MRAVFGILIIFTMVVGLSSAPAMGAQMEANLNPDQGEGTFKMTYQRTAFIEYPVGSNLAEHMSQKAWIINGTADSTHPEIQKLINSINTNIHSDGSTASIGDLELLYEYRLTGRDVNTSLDFKVVLTGTLTNFIITQDQLRTLVDLGWRAISSEESIVIDGVDVNIPLNMLRTQEPILYDLVEGTEAAEILAMHVLNADFILQQEMTNWHFLFDPTGISSDAGRFGLHEDLAGKVISSWTMGESSIREGIQRESEWDASVTGKTHPDIPGEIAYHLRAVESADTGNLDIVGFGTLDTLDNIEIAGVTPEAPTDYGNTATGDFPVFIIYGMAGLAAVGGGLFFMFSNRALKNEKQGQQGIDPSQLVGHQTSAAAGGYQTNRGEAQLRDESEYQKTRSYYEDESTKAAEPTPPEPEQVVEPVVAEATCSCIDAAELGGECDCQMQVSCLCDSTCNCTGQVCSEYVGSL